MKDQWYYATLIIILSIVVVWFAYMLFKEPNCQFEFKDIDGSTLCAVRK